MYKRKTEENLDCGSFALMKILGGKWKSCIINAIAMGSTRPSEIHKYFEHTSARVIDLQLSELLDQGVVERRTMSEGYPLHVVYSLTALGESLLPVIAAMDKWSAENVEFVRNPAMLREKRYQPERMQREEPCAAVKKLLPTRGKRGAAKSSYTIQQD